MKKKIRYLLKLFFITTLPSFLLFTVLFFPYNDSAGWITKMIAKATNNQVFLDFKEVGVSLLPSPALNLETVTIQAANAPTLKAKELSVAPSILGLITFKPGVSLYARGFFEGNVSLSTRGGSSTEKGAPTQVINIDAEKVALSEILKLLKLPIDLKGKLNLEASSTVDTTFVEQPEAEIEADAKKIQIISGSVPTPIGAVNLPQVSWSSFNLKANLADKKFQLEKATLGKQGDELFIEADGSFGIQIQKLGTRIQPMPTSMDLKLTMRAKKSFQKKFEYIALLEPYKSRTEGDVDIYRMRISSKNLRRPPKIEAIR